MNNQAFLISFAVIHVIRGVVVEIGFRFCARINCLGRNQIQPKPSSKGLYQIYERFFWQTFLKSSCRSTPARHAANLFHGQRHPSDQRET